MNKGKTQTISLLPPPSEGVGGGFQARTYRQQFSSKRFRSFVVNYKETDLWIGVDHASFSPEMGNVATEKVKSLRQELEAYLLIDPEFGSSLEPHRLKPEAPGIARWMTNAGNAAGVGPMAAVAGAFSESVGMELIQRFNLKEIVVENGGDIFLKLDKNLVMSIYAGNSPLSEKIGIEIPAVETPLGVCTSSGTVGPSLSFGKADAAMIACKNTALADAFATAFGNLVKNPDDVQTVVEKTSAYPEILSAILICGDKLGIRSTFEMKLVK